MKKQEEKKDAQQYNKNVDEQKIKHTESKSEQKPEKADEEDEESPFGGLRGSKNFRKNLGCGG